MYINDSNWGHWEWKVICTLVDGVCSSSGMSADIHHRFACDNKWKQLFPIF